MSPPPSVCVCIPTYRRPAMLRALLDDVVRELAPFTGTIVVADNEVSDEVRAIVEDVRRRLPATHYIPVAERGISQARNALVDAAFANAPGFDWIVMYDDDALLRPGALARLVDAGERLGADLVGGPAVGRFEQPCRSIFAANSILAYRTRWPTGPVARLEMTQNLAIARRFFDRVPRPLFQPRFGLTGGEDYDLFRRAERAGARQAWCDEAVIDEWVPGNRATAAHVFHRAFTTGMSMVDVDRGFDPVGRIWARTLYGLAGTSATSVVRAAAGRRPRAARDLLGAAFFAGRLAALVGFGAERYR